AALCLRGYPGGQGRRENQRDDGCHQALHTSVMVGDRAKQLVEKKGNSNVHHSKYWSSLVYGFEHALGNLVAVNSWIYALWDCPGGGIAPVDGKGTWGRLSQEPRIGNALWHCLKLLL